MAGKKRRAPSQPPPPADATVLTPLSKLTLSPGDVIEAENGQRYVYTADLRGCRWGRAMAGYAVGELAELPDVPVRLVFSPNAQRQEQKESVADPLLETRR